MKLRALYIGIIVVFAASLIYIGMTFIPDVTIKIEKPKPFSFAVVELFTSEGCSSCPTAEDLFADMYTKYSVKKLPVYFLAFHVDYWDYLGWADRFSKKEFSQRQYRYDERFGLQSVYTPQMIVNGKSEFVGSNRSLAEASVSSALLSQPEVQIDVKGCLVQSDSTIKVIYSVDRLPSGAALCFALVEKELKSEVSKGENLGKTLSHLNVVRSFQSSVEAEQSETIIAIPSELVLENASVIVFAQEQSTMKILGASALDLKTK